MAGVKISALPPAASVLATDLFATVAAGGPTTQKATMTQVATVLGINISAGVFTGNGVTVGSTLATKARLVTDGVRIPGTPIALLIPSAATSAMALDLMPTAINGNAATNILGTGNAWIDIVDRDINNSVNTNDWAVARIVIIAAGTPTGTATVKIGGFSGGATNVPALELNGQNIFFTLSGTTAGFLFSGGFYWGSGGGLTNGARLSISAAGNITTEGSLAFGTSADLLLLRDAANTLAQRNGVNAQIYCLYGTFTNSTNYERLTLTTQAAATILIDSEAAGTGTRRGLTILSASGTLGFFGVTPVVRQTQGATLTNNVTAGGSANTLANYTDLTIYANDAAAIRNDIYQLGQTLKAIVDGVRSLGLFT